MKKFYKSLLKYPLIIRVGGWAIAKYIRFVYLTTRWERLGWAYPEHYWKNNQPFLTCFWHNRLLMACFAWQGPHTFSMLISSHADGQLIARTVAHYGIKTISGSSSKGGSAALRAIVRVLKSGKTVGITPDGPRGPRFRSSEGIAAIARLTNLDILPVTYSVKRRKVLNSWDRFILAFPFTRGVLAWGEPICISQMKDSSLQSIAQTIEKALLALCDTADDRCGHAPLR